MIVIESVFHIRGDIFIAGYRGPPTGDQLHFLEMVQGFSICLTVKR